MGDKNRPDRCSKALGSNFINEIIDRIRKQFHDCPDLVLKNVRLSNGKTGYYLFLETLADPQAVSENLIHPLLESTPDISTGLNQIRSIATLINDPDADSITNAILSGAVILILEGEKSVLSIRLRHTFENPAEPEVEKIPNGPHEGFSADLLTNLTLLRNKLVSNRLKFKFLTVGELNPKKLVIAYFEGRADPQLLEGLVNKIDRLKLDKLIGTGQLETLIKDFPRSPFPQFRATARPDQAINSILEGKFLILLEGTPVTLSAPITFFDFFQKPDDLNFHWSVRSFLRLLRFLATFLATFLPALYIAIISFHYYIIPLNFLIPLAKSWAQVPFPPVVEVLFLETIIEILRESTVRLGSRFGASTVIIGGVLLGVASLSAGTISSSTLIASMVTLIASLILPIYDLGPTVRILKFTAILFAAVFGVLGLVVTASLIFAHLVTLESLGEPYLQPKGSFKLVTSSWRKRAQ